MQLRSHVLLLPRHTLAVLRWLVLVIAVAFLPACRSAPFAGLGDPEELASLTEGNKANGGDDDAAANDAGGGATAKSESRQRSVAETVRSARERIGSWEEEETTPPPDVDFSNDGWRRAISQRTSDPWSDLSVSLDLSVAAGPEPRWRHVAVDDWLATPPARRADIRRLLADPEPTVHGNAAIALARAGEADGRALNVLTATVERLGTKLPMRQAAAESLAWVKSPDVVERLSGLVDEFSSVATTTENPAAPRAGRSDALHAELLRALSSHVSACDDPRFTSALDSNSPEVLIAALTAWERCGSGRSSGALPVEIISLCDHPEPKVRSCAMVALSAHHHPQALPRIVEGLNDHDWTARRAAIHSLAVLGDADAIAELKRLLEDTGEVIRAEAVTALSQTSAWRSIDVAVDDESRRVREALAETLARRRDTEAAAIAEKLVVDRAVSVQTATLSAVHGWPDNMVGDVLIAALASRAGVTRHTSRDELLHRWPAAEASILAAESAQGDSVQSQAALADLRRRWRAEFGDSPVLAQQDDKATSPGGDAGTTVSPQLLRRVASLVDRWAAAQRRGEPLEPLVSDWTSLADGPVVVAALETLVGEPDRDLPDGVYQLVLPRLDSNFELLAHLTSNDTYVRRVAAGELRDRAAARGLSPLVVTRLRQTLVYERDALVWQAVLSAIGGSRTDDAITLASVALGHEQPMIRRQACEFFGATADRRYSYLLVDALTDPDQSVRRAALVALAFPRSVDDVGPLLRFLADTDVTMRLEAARTLAVIGSPEGVAALERMAYHEDANVRRHVAQVMGELGWDVFVPSLIHMLDDESRVQQTALESLAKCAGESAPAGIHARNLGEVELAGIWQHWWQESGQRGDGSLRAARR